MARIPTGLLVLALAAGALAPRGASAQEAKGGTLHVTAATVHTGSGETFSPGAVLIVDGKIAAVGGPDVVKAPAGARRIDGGPFSAVVPGLVAASSQHLAKGGEDPATISADVRALDGYDFFADESVVLAGGVTTVFLSPGSVRVVSGRGAVVKTAGLSVEHRTLREDAGLVAGIGDAVNRPPAIIEPPALPDATAHPLLPHRDQLPVTRAGSLLLLRDLLKRGREGDPLVSDVAAGRARLWLGALTLGDLEAAGQLVRETGVDAVFVGALAARDALDVLRESKVPVVLHWPDRPGRVVASGDARAERLRARARANAAVLARAGLPFALAPGDGSSLADLLFVCAAASRAGLDPERALSAVTLDAARILGVDDRVGSLAPGKDGDLILLSGPPTDPRSFPLRTVVDGNEVWKRKATTGTVIVRAAEVHVGDGRVFAPGEVAFEKGKIVEVGASVGVPPGARFIDLGGGAVIPGLIDAFSHAGLASEGGGAGSDLSTAVTAADALDEADPSFPLLLRQGVTTVLAAPGGSGRVIGRAAVTKTGGRAGKKRVLAKEAGLVVRLQNEGDLAAAVKQLDGMLKKAKDYQKALTKYAKDKKEYEAWKKKRDEENKKAEAEKKKKAEAEKKKAQAEKEPSPDEKADEKDDEKKQEEGAPRPEEKKEDKKKEEPKKQPDEKGKKKPDKKPEEKEEPRKPKTDEGLAGYKAALDRKVPVFVRASTVEEIRAALKLLVDKWKLRVVIVGGDEARRVKASLGKAKAAVIASPRVLVTERGRPVNLLRELSLSGLPAAVGSDAYLGGAELFELLAYAVSRGLAPHAAIRMATGDAAKILGVEARVGTLAPGRDADMVLLSAPPFGSGSRIVKVFTAGREVPLDR